MDDLLAERAARQDNVVARWQLIDAGWSARAVAHRTARLRALHRGVYLTGHAPRSARQRWRAATLTAPGSVLSHASAAACWGFRRAEEGVTITRPGSGGRRRLDGVLVFRSPTLAGDVTTHAGLPITTAGRTLLDIAPSLSDRALRKALREALRLRVVTIRQLRTVLARHPNGHGSGRLRVLAERYARLPLWRTRSDAEAMALELLDRAARPIPQVNVIVAGEEADLWWPDHRLIVEIDGPGYHRLRDDDARKTATWRAAGHTVRRLGSDDVFDRPHVLLALVPG